jgi:hypothetical protein
MKRPASILLCAALLAVAAPAFSAGNPNGALISFAGFDFESPDPGAAYLEVGDGYRVVGFVTGAGPLLAPWMDLSSYEYTFYIRDLTVSARYFVFPNLAVTFANNGRWSYYADNFPADGGTAAMYGTNPPNATAPSTFTDGTSDPNAGERLTGDIDDFVLIYNFAINAGSCGGNMTLDGGPDLIYVPAGDRANWSLRLSGQTNPTIPAGYDHPAEGEFMPPETPVAHRTWGALKALYR